MTERPKSNVHRSLPVRSDTTFLNLSSPSREGDFLSVCSSQAFCVAALISTKCFSLGSDSGEEGARGLVES